MRIHISFNTNIRIRIYIYEALWAMKTRANKDEGFRLARWGLVTSRPGDSTEEALEKTVGFLLRGGPDSTGLLLRNLI